MQAIKRGLLLLIAAALLMALLPGLASASGGLPAQYAFVVGTSSLNLRSGPGYQFAVIGSSPRGEMVQVISYQAGGGFYSVLQLSSGVYGYMDSAYLGPAPEAPLVTPPPVYPGYPQYPQYPSGTPAVVKNPVATQFLNLREQPSYAARVLGIYYNGTRLTVLSESAGWYYVQMESGLKGYFRSEYISFDLSVPPPAQGVQGTARIVSPGGKVNLRQGPGYNYAVLASYNPGKTVSVYTRPKGFWQVSVDGLMGYIDSRYLSSSAAPQPPGGSQGNAVIKSSAGSLNLRQQPTTTAKVIGSYKGGTAVVIRQQGLDWCQVNIPSTGANGYFMTKFLTLKGLPEIPTKVVKQPSGSYVNLRNLPSLSQGVVNMKVPHNSVVTVLSPGPQWSRVRFGTVNGYMMSSFLK